MPDYDEIGTPRLARQRVSREVQYRSPLEPAVISARNAAKPVTLGSERRPHFFDVGFGHFLDNNALTEEWRPKGRQPDQCCVELVGEACGKAHPLFRHAVRLDV